MKQLFTLLGIILLSTTSFAQLEVRLSESGIEQGDDISGTTQYINATTDDTYEINFFVKNISGSTMDVKVQRLKMDIVAGWGEYLCWGSTHVGNVQGGCWTQALMPTNPWTTPVVTLYPDTIRGTLVLHYTTAGPGCASYRYYFISGIDVLDSIDVQVCSSVGLNELNSSAALSVSPNPASGKMNVETSGISENGQLIITDMTGKPVFNATASNSQQIDISHLQNGVYFIVLTDQGTVVRKERIVVQHP